MRCALPGAQRALLAALAVTVALAACRTPRPAGTAITPMTATSVDAATRELRERRAAFRGMRSLMRVRATTNGRTQSFRAQLAVHDAQRMELVAYTPVGTTALTMRANGDDITSEPEVAPSAFAFLRAARLTPAETGMLLLGLPPRDDVQVVVAPGGLATATAGEIVVTFDPPAFPAKNVVITRGADRVEIEHLEVVSE